MTKTCPKCGTAHSKPGTFCSRACANSRQWNEEQKKVFSEKQTEYMAREESEEHRYKKSIQSRMLQKAGIMGNGGLVEDAEDIMTNPDDYFFVPPRDEGDNFSDGNDYWETV
jgi:endogenous inhibitor of DNA gyrase (YacG/DUF329 family)